MIDCKILNVNKSGCIDTAAVITVIPRTRDLPIAKLKLKGVTSHKANLYGPAMTEFEIGGKGIKKQVLEIGEGLDRVQVPFTLGETKTARIYTTDRVAYTIRAEGSFKLRPFVEREIQTKLVTDAVTDEPMGEGIGAFESSGNTQGLDLGGQGHTQSRVVLETQVADQAVLSGSKGTSEKGSLNKRGQLPGETKLGLFISNPAFGNKVSRLPLGVIAQSGVIPCLTAPISITMQNLGDKCVTIPKYAVLGEVFILHPDKYEQEFSTNFQEEEEVDEGIDEGMDTDETVQVNVINHDTTPFSDAEINTIPNLPAIGENEPLPKDLQDLVERSHGYHNLEIHPEDQPKTAIILPEGLGLSHRQFEFTRLSFGLSAAPGAFQYITDRVIMPAKEKTPENDLGDTVSVYLDDICIGGDNFPQMLQRLEALFNRIRAAGFLLKAKKCELFQSEVTYLGHRLSEQAGPPFRQTSLPAPLCYAGNSVRQGVVPAWPAGGVRSGLRPDP
ncbi:Retrovirus-related Pol polyprotein from transposon 17.6 [Frankliniella fusca]|uniref:Retrovirus-related Pol polyprotein from transposon 17.6 n=1 Tax=Frankliniella fusca TaxID=407009 RepID=A0AAE1LME2_9NEOP|nr:Retrovirus-related Pol polyprotein from transposon 17.6 [Frankliniella fusca]